MKISIREGMVPGETLPKQLAWLERVGLDGIELHDRSLDVPLPELQAVFGQTSVAASAVQGSSLLLSANPSERTAANEIIRARLEISAALATAGVLIVPQFGRQAALPDLSPYKTGAELERELLITQLRELAPAAADAGARLFLEPLIRYEAYLVNRLEQGVALAEEIGPQVAIMADFYHMGVEEADIAGSIRAAGKHIIYVHVADSNRLQPGRGHLDFRPGFAALKAIGYDGWLGIECRIDGPYDDSIRETATLLRELWAAA